MTLDVDTICVRQHAYLRGKSADTAVHEVDKADALVLSLDIAGAFNNINTSTLVTTMGESGVDPTLAALFKSL